MKVTLEPGKYVLAVSGGVDSMTLLNLLANKPGIGLVVAHFNHGIREDSHKDETLVKRVAKLYGLTFESSKGALGPHASEDTARNARYQFLKKVQEKHNAQAIITAHHQDDKVETALINLLRGTGRQGISAITDNPQILRPLLNTPKQSIVKYAVSKGLEWYEDSTNEDMDYLRNYLRVEILSKATPKERQNLIRNIDKVAEINKIIDNDIATLSHNIMPNIKIDRWKFTDLPSDVGAELMVYWLRETCNEFNRKTVERLSMSLKTAQSGTAHAINERNYLQISENTALFSNTL